MAGVRGVFLGVTQGEVTQGEVRRRTASTMPGDVRRAMAASLWSASRQAQRVEVASQMERWRQTARIGWLFAAAAAVVAIGFGGTVLRLTRQTVDIGPLIADGPIEEIGGTGNVSYRIAEEAGAARVWMRPVAKVPETAGGNVIWSDARQGGLAQLIGLEPNDPAVEQYQFWIVDADRPDGADRVPAGVFNVRERTQRDDQLRTLLAAADAAGGACRGVCGDARAGRRVDPQRLAVAAWCCSRRSRRTLFCGVRVGHSGETAD